MDNQSKNKNKAVYDGCVPVCKVSDALQVVSMHAAYSAMQVHAAVLELNVWFIRNG